MAIKNTATPTAYNGLFINSLNNSIIFSPVNLLVSINNSKNNIGIFKTISNIFVVLYKPAEVAFTAADAAAEDTSTAADAAPEATSTAADAAPEATSTAADVAPEATSTAADAAPDNARFAASLVFLTPLYILSDI